jgi:hypothetical protein
VRQRFSQVILQVPRGDAKTPREERLGKLHITLG